MAIIWWPFGGGKLMFASPADPGGGGMLSPTSPPAGSPLPGSAATGTKPYLERVPDPTDKNRMARFTEKLHTIVNSLIGKGQLNQLGPASWSLWVEPPATASSPGVAGTLAYDSNFYYLCVATDTWVRVAITTW